MDQRALAFAAYWRNSLADATLGKGAAKKSELDAFTCRPLAELAAGTVDGECVKSLFEGEPESVLLLPVVIRTRVFVLKTEHGQQRRDGKPAFLLPLLSTASLSRTGRLYPSGYTVVPRDILEPIELPALAIGDVDSLDNFLSKHPSPSIGQDGEDLADDAWSGQWHKYLAYCDRLLKAVANEWQGEEDGYVAGDCWYLYKAASAKGASTHILGLYDHMGNNRPPAPLFERYAAEARAAQRDCLPDNAKFAERLGHASDLYPLAKAQRDSLAHLLAGGDGTITCVNGPPGTGKTTLLLSVVATLWVKAALEGSNPPVVLAASTNNQAVTNIIDAFGRDFASGSGPLAGRWLPEVQSFGSYFPSIKKEAELAGIYQTKAFFDAVKNAAYLEKARSSYLTQAKKVFCDLIEPTVGAVVARLQDRIRLAEKDLVRLESLWASLAVARDVLRQALGSDPAAAMKGKQERQATLEAHLRALQHALHEWEQYLIDESIWLQLFRWIPAVSRKRLRLARRFWKTLGMDEARLMDWEQPEQLESIITENIADCARQIKHAQADIARCMVLLADEQRAAQAWETAAEAAGIDGEKAASLDACDCALDTTLRFEMFRLATHYWEGRWLLEMAAIPAKDLDRERKKQGRAAVEARWRRRMMLTPCAVSTFYMLPSVMKFQRAENGSFVPEYLYNFIDLLIVDEAGQVLPEVAGASFALAKNALVIGDTMQISPIWAIPRHVDVGNLIAHGLVEPGHAGTGYDAIVEAGKASASGSVMRIAQHASPYQYDPDLSPGLYLYEHRRCYDDIIDYCNALCYKGKLVPKRGPRPPDQDGLPALGYLHVDGMCQRNSSGSSFNNLEAATIAAWLAANKETLEARYQKPLSQVVGVVTPFSAQVSAISKACPELDITIGTVHALQGAERPVVIFSSVYSKHQDGQFIDRYPSMLNVAVSRAKDSFLVFGDMDVLELAPPSLPRGMLAASLFTEPGNALDFDMGARTDLEVHAQLTHLRDAGEHDAFLLETLATAQREVRIVTPWIQAKKVGEAVWDGFLKAVRRGVAIHIYTDGELNTASSNPEESARKREELDALLDMMAREGMRAVVVRRVHSKIVTVDANTYCVGSFNWFSASRDEAYARHETSLVYRGSALEREIESVKDSLERRMVCDYCQKREAA